MEVDGGKSSCYHQEKGFGCSADGCNWAAIDATSFRSHRLRKHRDDVPVPICLSAWVFPLNPNSIYKQYRVCCFAQDADEADPPKTAAQSDDSVDCGDSLEVMIFFDINSCASNIIYVLVNDGARERS